MGREAWFKKSDSENDIIKIDIEATLQLLLFKFSIILARLPCENIFFLYKKGTFATSFNLNYSPIKS